MERNIIIENICTACRCGERRAEEYLAAELRNLRELRDAGVNFQDLSLKYHFLFLVRLFQK